MNALRRQFALLALCTLVLLPLVYISADKLSYVSDTISMPDVATSSSHVIKFTVTQAIPVSGKIVVTPDPGLFTIPAALDYTDIDLAVATSGPYVDRTLAASASAAADGVAVVSGTSGSITITLNSTSGISAGSAVRVTIGSQASVGATGDQSIINPTTIGSFHIRLNTRNASNALLDSGAPIIVTTQPVTVTAVIPLTETILTDGLPSGTIPAGSENVELFVRSDLFAQCRYATSSGLTYDLMTNSIGPSGYGFLHYITLNGFQDNTTYTYYLRCITYQGVRNTSDYIISFTLEPTPDITTSNQGNVNGTPTTGPGGYLGPGGPGSEPNGANTLFLASVTLSGLTSPNSVVTILKDGVSVGTVSADSDGKFKAIITRLERGTYTLLAYATDSAGRNSAPYSATLSLGSGMQFTLSDIIIPPTIELSSDTVATNGSVKVSGESIPNASVQVLAQKSGDLHTFTASTTSAGKWSLEMSVKGFASEIYGVRARAVRSALSQSDFSKTLFLGVGFSTPPPASGGCALPDMNGDGKVNLVDFSIFLLSWNTSEPKADFNCNGTVNLADFSIMLFQWTG